MNYKDTARNLLDDVDDLISDLEDDSTYSKEKKEIALRLLDEITGDIEELIRSL